jgi:hypothetical protein
MTTKINTTDATTIESGFKNPFGMTISNTPEVRAAVADHAKSIIAKLHAERKQRTA